MGGRGGGGGGKRRKRGSRRGEREEQMGSEEERVARLWLRRGASSTLLSSRTIMDSLDDILVHLGSWHYPIIAFCFLRGFPAAYHAMAPTFIAPTLDHWCARPPELANWTAEQWISDGIPQTHT
ncbi:organic cation transporter protein isoform X2, partial [Ixodes scapularis]